MLYHSVPAAGCPRGKISSTGKGFGTPIRGWRDGVLRDARSRGSGVGEHHSDSVLRPQDDHGASLDVLARSQLKIVLSEQIAQDHQDLQHRVISADAAARPGSE